MSGGARTVAVCGAAVAAAIHLAVSPEHLQEWWVYGVFFLALATSQVVLAWLLVRGPVHIGTLVAGLCATLGAVGIYVVSRTIGLPAALAHGHGAAHVGYVLRGVGNGVPVLPGSSAGRVERVGLLDLSCLAAELALVVALVSLLPDRVRAVTTNLMLVAALLLLAGRVLRAVA